MALTFNKNIISDSSSRSGVFQPGLFWSTLVGGIFLSLLTYWLLVSIGLGLGSFGLQVDSVTGDTLQALSVGAVIWLMVTFLLALGVGAYLCVRMSAVRQVKHAAAQGAIIASVFFAIMAMQATSILVPMASQSLASLNSATMSLSSNPRFQNFLEDATAGIDLRGIDRPALAKAIGTRLIMDDDASLRNLLARHSNMSLQEIETRVAQLESTFNRVSTEVTNGVGKALAVSGWMLFFSLLIGTVGAMLGGWMGARMNTKYSGALAAENTITPQESRAA